MPCREWHDVVGCAALTATIGVCTWLVTPVQARPVAPGEFIDPQLTPLTGVSLAEDPDLLGSIIADLTVPFSDGLVLMGTIRTFVVRETTTGTLDFYYEMNPVTDEFIINGFDQFTTDVDWRTDLGTGARGAGRSIDGDELTFSMPAGGPTFVKTDATSFALRGEFVAFADAGGPGPATATVFTPVIPIPPAALAAPAGFALAYLAARRMRRRRR